MVPSVQLSNGERISFIMAAVLAWVMTWNVGRRVLHRKREGLSPADVGGWVRALYDRRNGSLLVLISRYLLVRGMLDGEAYLGGHVGI